MVKPEKEKNGKNQNRDYKKGKKFTGRDNYSASLHKGLEVV